MSFSLKQPIIYVTRDLERSFGLPISTPNYFIISNSTRFAKQFLHSQKNVLLIKEKGLLDTHELLNHRKTLAFVKKIKNPNILVFKNTATIERVCQEKKWNLLNPSAILAGEIEEKISQVKWLGSLAKYLPPYEIKILKDVRYEGKKFILQFNRAHTGNGTILVDDADVLDDLIKKFPNREVRITKYISGLMLTNNNIVLADKILCGNISVQLTGIKPFTALPFATVGNDFALTKKILNKKQEQAYFGMAEKIGEKMRKSGWKGLFGIDVVLDKKSGKLYLIEINARQPASTSFESKLQRFFAGKKDADFTSFEAHLLALLGQTTDKKLIKIKSGAQITQKVFSETQKIPYNKIIKKINLMRAENLEAVFYDNAKIEADLLRWQSKTGLVDRDLNLNPLGKQLAEFSLEIMNKKLCCL